MNSIYDILNKLNNIQPAEVSAASEQQKPKSKLQESIDSLSAKLAGSSATKMGEAAAPIDFDKVLDAIAALYGDDIWENDAMQDLANDLEQAGPTDRELDFIIAKGKLPKRLANIQFSAGDNVRFGEAIKEIPGGRRHTSEPGGYGRKDDEEAPKVQTQRGRGRPKKNADSETGEVMKPDWSAFGVGKVNLPKHKGAVTKHKMVGEEDDVEEGNEFSGALKAARDSGAKEFEVGGKKYKVSEVAPPGAKAERMVKHIKKGYAKDGKLSDKEKSIAYATAWKAHKAGKVEEAVASLKPLLDGGMTAKQISEGWEDMMKAAKKQQKDSTGTGKFDKKKISTGTVYTRKYDADGMSNTDHEAKSGAEKRGRGRPKKNAFESAIDRLMAEVYSDVLKEGQYTYMPTGDEIAGKNPEKMSLVDKLKAGVKKVADKIAPDDETLLRDLEKKTIGEEDDDTNPELSYEQEQLRQAIGDDMFDQVKSAVEQGLSLGSTNMPDDIYDALFDYYAESGEMPYGTAKARDGDPVEWIETRLEELFSDVTEGQEMTNDLAEMMKLAGMQVKEAAKPDFLDIDKDGDKKESMKDAAKDAKEEKVDEAVEQVDECGAAPMAMPMGELTISGSPEALAAMLRLAGMQVPAMQEEQVEEEKDPRYEASTTPEEEVMPVQVQIKGGNGEVAGMEKEMHKDGAARFSDNPLAMKESVDDLNEMGRDLIKAYESIKIQK